jgi:hypothetical protein
MAYIYKTLTLRELYRTKKINDMGMIDEYPLCSNYEFENSIVPGTVIRNVYAIHSDMVRSLSPIRHHFEVQNLTGDCYLQLTQIQALAFGLSLKSSSYKLFD